MIKFGTISKIDVKKGYYCVDIDEDEITTKAIPVICLNTKNKKDESPLEQGEHVAVLMDEHFEDGVILGSIYSEADTPPSDASEDVYRTTYQDGSYVKFDKSTGEYTINAKGNVIIESAKDVKITCTKLELSGDLSVTGKIDATQDIATSGGDVKAGIITLKLHKHPYTDTPVGASTTSPAIP